MRDDYDRGKAHYHRDGEEVYVDSNFINSSQNVLADSELVHMGFGEFFLRAPDGKVEFDRMGGKEFNGQVGRPHKLYDNVDGELAKKLLDGMADKAQEV